MLRSSPLRFAPYAKIAVLGAAKPPLRIEVGGTAAPPSLPGVWSSLLLFYVTRHGSESPVGFHSRPCRALSKSVPRSGGAAPPASMGVWRSAPRCALCADLQCFGFFALVLLCANVGVLSIYIILRYLYIKLKILFGKWGHKVYKPLDKGRLAGI